MAFETHEKIRTLFKEQDALVVDVRDADEIERGADATVGHLNIPWSAFSQYRSLIANHGEIFGGKDRHLLVNCRAGRRAGFFIDELKACGYTNCHNCVNPAYLKEALPDVAQTAVPNTLSPFSSHEQIQQYIKNDEATILDVREPEEIEKYGDAMLDHINIPCSHFAEYVSRINMNPHLLGPRGRNTPLLVHCMRGRRAANVKDILEKECGFTCVYNCENPERMKSALPGRACTAVANELTVYPNAKVIQKLVTDGAVIIDAREVDEIESMGDAIAGHVNIPWTSFGKYASNNRISDGVISGSKEKPLLVYCMRGGRAALLSAALKNNCGFEHVLNCENAARIKAALPDIEQVAQANTISPFAEDGTIRALITDRRDAIIIDCREAEEISNDGNAIKQHVHIPWSTFNKYSDQFKVETSKETSLLTSGCNSPLGNDPMRPIMIYCGVGWRSGYMKKELEQICGYRNVYNCKNSNWLLSACPDLEVTALPNSLV